MRIPQSPPAAVIAPFSKGARAMHTKAPLAKGGRATKWRGDSWKSNKNRPRVALHKEVPPFGLPVKKSLYVGRYAVLFLRFCMA